MTTLRLVMVDNHPVVRDAVRRVLGNAPDVELVAEGVCGADVESLVAQHQPGVLLLDLGMPQTQDSLTARFDPLAALAWLRKTTPKQKW